jgi:CDP-diacylglycerol--serine O-phosphatidyltransferase
VIYEWALHDLGKLGWLAAFLYTAAAALRLARFNTQVGVADKRYFQGLASPSGAALVAGLVWVGSDLGFAGPDLRYLALAITVVVALLMVSNFRYHSFKGFDLKGKVPFVTVLAIVFVLVLVSTYPPPIIFGLFAAYALSGPLLTVVELRRRRGSRRRSQGEDEHDAA